MQSEWNMCLHGRVTGGSSLSSERQIPHRSGIVCVVELTVGSISSIG